MHWSLRIGEEIAMHFSMSKIVCNFVQLHLSQRSGEEEVGGVRCIVHCTVHCAMHCALVTGEEVGSVHCTVQCIVHWSLVRRRWVEVRGVKCIVHCTVHWSLVGSS